MSVCFSLRTGLANPLDALLRVGEATASAAGLSAAGPAGSDAEPALLRGLRGSFPASASGFLLLRPSLLLVNSAFNFRPAVLFGDLAFSRSFSFFRSDGFLRGDAGLLLSGDRLSPGVGTTAGRSGLDTERARVSLARRPVLSCASVLDDDVSVAASAPPQCLHADARLASVDRTFGCEH